MYERKNQNLERKVASLATRLALPEAPYQDREIAAGWLRHHRMLKFNPNHDSRGRFDFGGGGDESSGPTTSPKWPTTYNPRLNVDKATQHATDHVVPPAEHPFGIGKCAQHVREALRAGGINIPAAGVIAKD